MSYSPRACRAAERLLADELHGLGVKKVRPLSGGASFFGAPEDALRVCLWSRLAGRVNLTVGRVAARDADALYAGRARTSLGNGDRRWCEYRRAGERYQRGSCATPSSSP